MIRDDGRRAAAKAIPILEVASRLGIADLRPAGSERVGPCPVCGGRDRFSINPGLGVFVCRICDAGGDGLALAQHVLGCYFQAALDFLVGKAGAVVDTAELERRKRKATEAEARRQEYEAQARARAVRDAREIWHAARGIDPAPAQAYLAGRGITFAAWPPTLRFLPDHPARKMIGRQLVTLHQGPCMVAAVQDALGKVTAVHQTWIDPARPGQKARITLPDGTPAPSKMVRGSKKGGAIRLSGMTAAGVLVMGEGIETTASMMMAAPLVAAIPAGAAFWAGVDLGNMAGRQVKVPGARHSGQPDLDAAAAFVPPEGTRALWFLQDGDSDPAATRAKLLAGIRRARALRPGLRGFIISAPEGRDLNEIKTEESDT